MVVRSLAILLLRLHALYGAKRSFGITLGAVYGISLAVGIALHILDQSLAVSVTPTSSDYSDAVISYRCLCFRNVSLSVLTVDGSHRLIAPLSPNYLDTL
jgi:hypothetical protein